MLYVVHLLFCVTSQSQHLGVCECSGTGTVHGFSFRVLDWFYFCFTTYLHAKVSSHLHDSSIASRWSHTAVEHSGAVPALRNRSLHAYEAGMSTSWLDGRRDNHSPLSAH
jgi:hypothetical protein